MIKFLRNKKNLNRKKLVQPRNPASASELDFKVIILIRNKIIKRINNQKISKSKIKSLNSWYDINEKTASRNRER